VVEHFPWKKLPEHVFDSLGGKAKAKELRRIKIPRAKPVVPLAAVPATPAPGAEAGSATVPAEPASEQGRKRRLSNAGEGDDKGDSGSGSRVAKRVRTGSKDASAVLSWLNESEGVMDLVDGAAENDAENEAFKKSVVNKSENILLAAEIPDMSGRDFVPVWRRHASSSSSEAHVHHHHDNRPIQVTWSVLQPKP
jgi:hypothetical protein